MVIHEPSMMKSPSVSCSNQHPEILVCVERVEEVSGDGVVSSCDCAKCSWIHLTAVGSHLPLTVEQSVSIERGVEQ